MSSSAFKNRINKLPKSPGVYEFRDKQGKILYIGKATSLKDRVGSYFLKNAHLDRPNIEPMMAQIADIKIHETDSVLEALILESNLIKARQPKYNIERKDDKSFVQVVITKENFPRVLVDRIQNSKFKMQNDNAKLKNKKILDTKYQLPATKTFGPYTSRKQLEIALKLIRKIFPYHSAKRVSRNCCFDHQIGLCPGPYAGAISQKDYLKNIHGIEMILQGKKKFLLKELEKQMREYSKKNEFEKAAEARNRIFALEHIRDVALISEDKSLSNSPFSKGRESGFPLSKRGTKGDFRIEAYDISNIGGDYAVGSMIVFQNSHPDKSQYRKFKIKTVQGIDDVAMMREVLLRRFRNNWPKPDLILLDGGKGHLGMTERLLKELRLSISVVAVAKGPTRKISNFQFLISNEFKKSKISNMLKEIIKDKKLLSAIISEAHRFAISYHKKLRGKSWKER
jgi:excinuclease ABC subunit C